MNLEPELVAAFLFFMIAPIGGFYIYANVQAFIYRNRAGAPCSLKSTSGPP
jgi:hypothetical protein